MKNKDENEVKLGILKDIVKEFLKRHKVPFGFNAGTGYTFATAEVVLRKNKFVKSSILNLAEGFSKEVEKIAKERGATISWNNTGCTFWVREIL